MTDSPKVVFGCGCTQVYCKCNTPHLFSRNHYWQYPFRLARLFGAKRKLIPTENCYWCPFDKGNEIHAEDVCQNMLGLAKPLHQCNSRVPKGQKYCEDCGWRDEGKLTLVAG